MCKNHTPGMGGAPDRTQSAKKKPNRRQKKDEMAKIQSETTILRPVPGMFENQTMRQAERPRGEKPNIGLSAKKAHLPSHRQVSKGNEPLRSPRNQMIKSMDRVHRQARQPVLPS